MDVKKIPIRPTKVMAALLSIQEGQTGKNNVTSYFKDIKRSTELNPNICWEQGTVISLTEKKADITTSLLASQ
jgi:hypothetical protein